MRWAGMLHAQEEMRNAYIMFVVNCTASIRVMMDGNVLCFQTSLIHKSLEETDKPEEWKKLIYICYK
jgi:hypothetical protein